MYVGYMYGAENSTTFSEANKNENSAPIKKEIDTWYFLNLVSKNFNRFISETVGFCGDRSLSGYENEIPENIYSLVYHGHMQVVRRSASRLLLVFFKLQQPVILRQHLHLTDGDGVELCQTLCLRDSFVDENSIQVLQIGQAHEL